MNKAKVVWECAECGYVQPKWAGVCGQCRQWNTFVEQITHEIKKNSLVKSDLPKAVAVPLSEVSLSPANRIMTGVPELDEFFGKGIVTGSLTLIGGQPGIGKSTLILQMASYFAKNQKKVLYVCGEESLAQTSLRAKRMGITSNSLYLLHETDFYAIKEQIDRIKPDVLMIDSIQILYKSDIPSSPGSVSQVRELATEFLYLSKGLGLTTFLVGHVTKSGDLAGPRVLEHLVDTVLEFEGERKEGFRLLRSIKNRFGSTEEILIFQMKENGLEIVENPSIAFLEERGKKIPGSVIVPTIEGTRAILIEAQALVTPTVFPTPSRRSAGLDQNRLALLLAVLEKRLGYRLHTFDVFVSLAGGMKITEPAIDLGVLLAIASSYSHRVVDPETIVFGEVGLGGEVRSITRGENRIKEAILRGFTRCILPKRNLKEISKATREKISLYGIEVVDEAISQLL